ncbi:MAG: toll/interleukin-1 receptor domain-containing protein [candidate division KSB1 bacterium]|nr:toll/interleukin-1 receptor domain-containing protein [candidate division KSB1 bacterium]MDZ7303850.1 toll/interleukin-1 receptor domain-containing protein [candidate division KSB1 bacterium]MDZ7312751.1 toll/interleukin-1 receptor domain-containing protein [candidate division KSB1 bacterium]
MQTTYDIFVSYNHKHRDWVRSFVEALEKHHLKVWFDEKAILPGESFVEKLEEGIRNSNAVVYIVTPEAVHSKWALIELGAALGGEKTLIPIVSEDVPVGELATPIRRRRWITKSDPLANANEVARLFSQNGGGSKNTAN